MLPQLDPTWYIAQLFWLSIFVVFMHLVLSRVLLPRLMGAITLRDVTKSSALDAAEGFKRQAEEVKLHYEGTLADARARSQQVFADAEVAIRDASTKAQAQMDATLASRMNDAKTRIQAQVDQLKTHLSSNTAEFVSEIAARMTGVMPDAASVSKTLKTIG